MGRAARKIPPKVKPTPEIDLEPFQNAVNEAAARVRGLWLGYIALLAYLFIAGGAVTHRDLLLQNPVKLPVLNVELPLVGFFVVAPAFFLINHFFLLLQLFGLGQRIKSLNNEIRGSGINGDALKKEMLRLDTFVIVQLLSGMPEKRDTLTRGFLYFIAFITLVIAPIVLLLTIQLQFLPYQFEAVTWWHRAAVSIDLALLWIFWPSIRRGDWATLRNTPILLTTSRAIVAVSVILFTSLIATFPGEFADGGKHAEAWREHKDSNFPGLKGWLFGDLTEREKREWFNPFSRAIDLPDNTTLIDLNKFDKIRKRHKDNNESLEPWQTGRTLDLRERNLRGAMFDRSDLRNVDLFTANLQGASLEHTKLQGASLEHANLQGASLNITHLWRAFGEPDHNYLADAWVNRPQRRAPTADNLARIEMNALAGVRSKKVKQRIKKKIARLWAPKTKGQESWIPTYWSGPAKRVSEADHRKVLAIHLKVLACDELDAPYVAQGLMSGPSIILLGIKTRLEDVGASHLPRIAKSLLDAAEGKTSDCPGAKGLNATAIAKLRKWAATAKNKPEQK